MTRRGDGAVGRPKRMRPRDLAKLDRNLSEILIEERSSFGAELRAELAAEYGRLLSGPPPRSGWLRPGRLAAVVAVLLLAGTLLVPAARGSLVRLLTEEPKAVSPVFGADFNAKDRAGDAPVTDVVSGDEAVPEPETAAGAPVHALPDGSGADNESSTLAPMLPVLLDREEARHTLQEEYPVALQQAGVGGVVRVLLWVRPDGMVETPRVRASSGVTELDRAALRAARLMRFMPATRAGKPVGTWVDFSIRFLPNATGSQPDPQYQAFEIPLSN